MAGGIQFNEHCDDLPAEIVFRHACKLGFESIVSKRLGSPYRSGRSRDCFGTNPPMRSLPIAPIFIADRASLAVSREKDGKIALGLRGQDDFKVVLLGTALTGSDGQRPIHDQWS